MSDSGRDEPPLSVRLRPGHRVLVLEWAKRFVLLQFDTLRAHCPCAECRSARLKGRSITLEPDIGVIDVQPYGPNALQLVFSDGHRRGIFPFGYLAELARPAAA